MGADVIGHVNVRKKTGSRNMVRKPKPWCRNMGGNSSLVEEARWSVSKAMAHC